MHHKLIDIVGTRFGKLVVLERDTKRSGVYWVCKCDCGNTVSIRSDCLRKRGYNNCGCDRQLIKIGDRFGLYTVIKRGKKGLRHVQFWICQCDCGNISEVRTSALLNGRSKSCGCFVKQFERYKNPHQVGNIRPYFWENIKRGAQTRKIKFELKVEDVWNQWLSQSGKCALTNMILTLPDKSRNQSTTTASLDRIDSNDYYHINNIQWIHKHVNIMKNKFDNDYFINICKLVTNRR